MNTNQTDTAFETQSNVNDRETKKLETATFGLG
jgi:hypothetical protein